MGNMRVARFAWDLLYLTMPIAIIAYTQSEIQHLYIGIPPDTFGIGG